MNRILFVNASPRENSRTLELATFLLDKMEGVIKEVHLSTVCPAFLTTETLKLREQLTASEDYSHPMFQYAHDFAQADCIVIAAPYWDFMFPAMLKNYLENVSVTGITFRYSPEGIPMGLCKAKKLYYITTAGGYMGDNDYGCAYVKALAGKLFGIKEVQCIYAEGLDITPEVAKDAMEKAKKMIEEIV